MVSFFDDVHTSPIARRVNPRLSRSAFLKGGFGGSGGRARRGGLTRGNVERSV
jgi:hypothetical protein